MTVFFTEDDVVDGLVGLCLCGGTDLELVVYIAVVEEYCLCSADNTEGIAYAALAVDREVELEAEGLCDCLYSPITSSVS